MFVVVNKVRSLSIVREVIRDLDGGILAIVFDLRSADGVRVGTHMFVPSEWGVQVGIARHSKGYRVAPHLHIRTRNEIVVGTEVLIVLRGRIKVDLYSDDDQKIRSIELSEGMGIAMVCGHSVEFLEDSVLIEVKEGPYPGVGEDKVWI